MFASFEYQLSKEEYVRGLRVVATLLLAEDRWGTWRCLASLALIVGAATIGSLAHPGSTDGILLAFVLFFVCTWLLNARYVRHWHGLSYGPDASESKLTFSADGVTRARPIDEQHWPWDSLRRIHELPEIVLLEFTGWNHITLPDRLWPDPDQRTAFINELRATAPNLLPDFPAEKLGAGKRITLLPVGAVVAGFDLFIALNAGAVMLLCQCANHRTQVEDMLVNAWRSGLLTAIFLGLAILGGFLIHTGLKRMGTRWPRLATGVAASFILMFFAVVVAGLLTRAS